MALALLAGPGTPAGAAPWHLKWRNVTCAGTGGPSGVGSMAGEAQITEHGKWGVNYMKIIFKSQSLGTEWADRAPAEIFKSATFANDSQGHTFGWVSASFGFSAPEVGSTVRLLITYQWWDKRDGPDNLLKKQTRAFPCIVGAL
jgi:hypothetical protein